MKSLQFIAFFYLFIAAIYKYSIIAVLLNIYELTSRNAWQQIENMSTDRSIDGAIYHPSYRCSWVDA